MKKDEIEVGQIYAVKVSGWLAPVRITEHASSKGWFGINLNTGRKIRVLTAAKCRFKLVKAGEKYKKVPAKEVQQVPVTESFMNELDAMYGDDEDKKQEAIREKGEEYRRERQAEYDEANNPPLEMPPM